MTLMLTLILTYIYVCTSDIKKMSKKKYITAVFSAIMFSLFNSFSEPNQALEWYIPNSVLSSKV